MGMRRSWIEGSQTAGRVGLWATLWLVGLGGTVHAQSGDMPPVVVRTLTDTLPGAVGGLTVDRGGTLYAADFGDRIWKIAMTGEVSVLTDGMYGASGNAIDSKGRILQANFHGNFIARVERDGRYEVFAEGLEGPVGIAMGTADTAYVVNCRGNSVSRIAPNGEVEGFASSQLFNCPNGITRDPDGNLYVVNFSDSRMLKLAPNGEVSEFASIPGNGSGHVAYAGEMLYATGFRANRVYAVTMDGSVGILAGSGSFGVVDGVGIEASFSTPNGIATNPQGTILYTNDYLLPFRDRGKLAPLSVVRAIDLPGLTATLLTALDHAGIEGVEVAYERYRRQHPGFTGLEVNALGYRLLEEDRLEAAVALFEWNARDYPTQWWTWDSLGDGFRAAGEVELAIQAYEKSLELNEGNENAINALGELRP
jgi:DNA-binding beta-propeller fold protein YncE